MGLIKVGSYEPKHLSFSTISTYRMCGKQFQLSKVMQLEQRPGLAGIGGNAVHTATEQIDALIWEHGFDVLDQEPVDEADPGF